MPNTPVLNLPYPTQSDTADVPRDIEALAVKLDTVVTGLLLAVKQYAPASIVLPVPANTWASLHAQDGNLSVGPVAAPASGRVIAKMRGGYIAVNGGGVTVQAGIGTQAAAAYPDNGGPVGVLVSGQAVPFNSELLIGGLTAGASYTFYPYMYIAATNGSLYLSSDGLAGGPFLMQVHAA